jgi:hypothetical protein
MESRRILNAQAGKKVRNDIRNYFSNGLNQVFAVPVVVVIKSGEGRNRKLCTPLPSTAKHPFAPNAACLPFVLSGNQDTSSPDDPYIRLHSVADTFT